MQRHKKQLRTLKKARAEKKKKKIERQRNGDMEVSTILAIDNVIMT